MPDNYADCVPVRHNHAENAHAASAPTHCAAMNSVMLSGAMPENESVSERATVIAGLANDVDEVNQ